MKRLVTGVTRLKQKLGIHTYHLEMGFVALVLIITAIISQKGWIEWIGVLAVFFTFGHVSVADRLEEQEKIRQKKSLSSDKSTGARCYEKLEKYYYAKEICWFVYFVFLGARSAIVGVILFLLYGPWRTYRRKHNPVGPVEDNSTP